MSIPPEIEAQIEDEREAIRIRIRDARKGALSGPF